jgi:type IV pilus assembly protein PilA
MPSLLLSFLLTSSKIDMKHSQKGFTLIELMVVISIIAVLSSVVLAGLQTARVKARNSRIVQEVQQLKNQIELTRSGDTYTSLVGSNASGPSNFRLAMHASFPAALTTLVTDILAQNGFVYPAGYGGAALAAAPCPVYYTLPNTNAHALTIYVDNTTCGAANKYAIYAAMGPIVGSSGYFCIDSTGSNTRTTSGGIPNTPAVSTTCQ